ncbi:AGE family epimerase/isomerase [Neptunicella marina]|uniref:AGE family epimerase/isomerase n=1 Tax=Neptunicella marina TaxID=2125989 RepID=A0A8J6IV35_9ALTE|nr:AGE family epimerase/isomerase [Neptunicella marina]MBC3766188.1 AGE family epimerase/isomerase [Neptunicella marina]
MAISAELTAATARFKHWMVEQALPLWSTVGIDPTTGGVFERLNADGTPDNACNKRVRVQSRQQFVFAYAAHQGWMQNAKEVNQGIENFMEKFASRPDLPGIYMHLLDADNQVIDARQDLYDIAFFLLASAYQYQLTNENHYLERANHILKYINTHFKQAPGGWTEGDYAYQERRQNPHMHLFEAFLALYEITNDGKWLAKAGEIYCLFETRFYDHDKQILLEFFQQDWQPVSNDRGELSEPGHMMEWVWLLRKYQQFTQTPVDTICTSLYEKTLAIGRDEQSGLLFDETTLDGKVTKPTKRLWPITELIKANIAQAQAGDKSYEEKAADAINLLFKYYISDTVKGAYVDQLDENNQVCMDMAPASTLYHLMLACAEAVRYCNQAR